VVNVDFKAWVLGWDFSLNLSALVPTIETSAIMVLSVLISVACGCEADGFVPWYGRIVDSNPIMMIKS